MKKILASLFANTILDILLQYAIAQKQNGGTGIAHYERWNTIIEFLQDIRKVGLPL